MKMSYLLRNKRKRSPSVVIATIVVVIILILNFFLPNALAGFFQTIARPFWKLGNGAEDQLASVGQYAQSKRALIAENERMQRELSAAEIRLQTLHLLAKENDELRALMGHGEDKSVILAYVLRAPGSSPYDTFVIDVGSNTGIMPGDVVTVEGVLPIGTVAEVYRTTALVRLYSSPGQETEVVIEGQDTHATAVGRGGGNFELKIPRDLAVTEGVNILLPNSSPHILGKVLSIEADVTHSLQTLLFRSPINFREVDKVLIERVY